MAGPKRWIPLPKGAKVHSFFPLHEKLADEDQSREPAAQPLKLKSCLRQFRQPCTTDEPASPRSTLSRVSSLSTVDSLSQCRGVHFCDGLVPGCDSQDDVDRVDVPLAQWIFIDRDICGISLYTYNPSDAHLYEFEYFSSSPYGRLFCEELKALHTMKRNSRSRVSQKDRELDDALSLAGVDELLVEDPESYLEYVCVPSRQN
jgi:hypothetical protein